MKIIHISAECYPIAKVGGLADVVGALPIYQNKLGVTSQVLMPFYDNTFTQNHRFKSIYSSSLFLGKNKIDFRILSLENSSLHFDVFFVDVPSLLHTSFVYSEDDIKRFLAFQIASLNWIVSLKEKPSLIHCHDHHTGLVPFMMSHCQDYKKLNHTPSVLNIHNAQYQGWFSHEHLALLPSFNTEKIGLLEWNDCINPLAAAIKCAWRVVAVSPNYMEELKQNANGLESLLRHESAKCLGILNGIDTAVWDPETDSYLLKNYSKTSIQSGKKASKKWLCTTYGLDPKKPLFAFIGRLVHEKGADLFPEIFETALQEKDICILLLGSGNKTVEKELKQLAKKYKGSFNAHIGYDEQLSHYIYAGADFLLMPSRVEPCGLNQMYALRYGTIPIVNATGGLKDTIIDVDKKGFGFVHHQVSVPAVAKAIQRATQFYKNPNNFKKTRTLIMRINHSWDASAAAYINLYKSILN